MVPLRQHKSIRVDEGYSVDEGTGSLLIVRLLFGWAGVLGQLLHHYVLGLLLAKTAGEQRQNRYDRRLKDYPNSAICTHCCHRIRQK